MYSVNGVNQNAIITNLNPYIIETNEQGVYELVSFSDVSNIGWTSGSAFVTISKAPEAIFSLITDTLSVIYPTAKFTDNTIQGDEILTSWIWNFGDNTFTETIQNPEHDF